MRPHTLYIVLLSAVGLAACATFRPPDISYDDDPKPAVFQGETTEARGGRGDPKAAATSGPTQGHARRKGFGPGTEESDRARRQS